MDAQPLLPRVARAIAEHGLDAVLIGNAAAALHGAPVTTVDFDFFVRRSVANKKKLRGVARALDATLYQPFYPVSRVVRLMNDDSSLQVDFMDEVSGARSFESVRERALAVNLGSATIRVATLEDIIKSKRAAGRARNLAVIETWRRRLKKRKPTRKERLAQLQEQNEWLERDLIRRRIAALIEQRMNFLRKRVAPGRTCL